jgi:hypothetical protein
MCCSSHPSKGKNFPALQKNAGIFFDSASRGCHGLKQATKPEGGLRLDHPSHQRNPS